MPIAHILKLAKFPLRKVVAIILLDLAYPLYYQVPQWPVGQADSNSIIDGAVTPWPY